MIANITENTNESIIPTNNSSNMNASCLPCSLGDRVWYDNNGNGVQDEGETGVAGMLVKLYRSDNNSLLATTQTDKNGNYLFSELLAGNYYVQFEAVSGYVFTAQQAGSDTTIDSDADGNGQTGSITIDGGDADLSIDAGLVKPASVGDTVWYDSNGSGLWDAGEVGMSGVGVHLYKNDGTLVADTVTDANGNYHFSQLLPGEYSVKLDQPSGYVYSAQNQSASWLSSAEVEAVDSDADNCGVTQPFTLAAGECNHDIDAGFYQPASLGDTVWHDSNASGLWDAGEVAISGVGVTLYSGDGSKVASTKTDSYGNYYFNQLKPGEYYVQFDSVSGYQFTGQNKTASWLTSAEADAVDSDVNSSGTTHKFTLAAGEYNNTIDAGLYKMAAIGDTVWNDSNASGLWDAGETGISGVCVTLYNGDGSKVASTKTDSYGNYYFNQLKPGEYYVQFDSVSGYQFTSQNKTASWLTSSEADALDSDVSSGGTTHKFTLSAGEYNNTIDAGLYKPASVGNTVWHDSNGNDLWDAGEAGISGVGVTLYKGDGSKVASSKTDASGNYSFTQLMPGEYYVKFDTPSGYVASSANQTASWLTATQADALDSDANSSGTTHKFTLAAGECNNDIDAAFYKSASLGDTVWNDKNASGLWDAGETGISGVSVHLYKGDGTFVSSTQTNSAGNYYFTQLKPGEYYVKFDKVSGYQFTGQNKTASWLTSATADALDSDVSSSGVSHKFVLASGEYNSTIDAGLYAKTYTIGNRAWHDTDEDGVQDSGEEGVGGVKIELYNSSKQLLGSTYTDANGYYKFTNLAAGGYRLYVPTDDYGKTANYWLTANDCGSSHYTDSDFTQNKANTAKKDSSYGWNTQGTDGTGVIWLNDANASFNESAWDVGLTPIVLDLNGDGIQTVSRAHCNGEFDLLGNGQSIQSGWLSGNDGFIAIDNNGDGSINDINELFGGQQQGDGFAKLASFDSNGDGLVNNQDARFAELLIWQDANGNHQTDAGELTALAELVSSLQVGYTNLPELDANGNVHLERSLATLADGSRVDMTDVYFNVSAQDAAGFELPSIQDLLSGNHSLDSVLLGSDSAVVSNAVQHDLTANALNDLSKLAALFELVAA